MTAEKTIKELKKSLTDKSNHTVARAAERAAELGANALVAELEAAFDRFVEDGAERDKTCAAKTAIARALETLEASSWSLFSRGMRIVQKEPEWGGTVDTAASLRAICAVALARSRDPAVVIDILELLVDREKIARMGAAQALGVSGAPEAIAVLRFKALAGDADPEVLSECFASLVVIDSGGVGFVARFLAHEGMQVREVAALALGQSRKPAAFLALKGAWSSVQDRNFARVLLVAVAVLRLSEATDWLIALIEEASFPGAVEAVRALAIYKEDPVLVDRVRSAVSRSGSDGVEKAFRKEFDRDR